MEPKISQEKMVPSRTNAQNEPLSDQWRLVQLEELGRLIWEKRQTERLNLEDAAGQVGISVATLWRLEQQRTSNKSNVTKPLPDPDMKTVSAAARWLGVSIERFLDRAAAAPHEAVVHHQAESTPDIVEAHLRADRALDERAAAALARMFRLAYEQVQDLRPALPEDARNLTDKS